MFVIRKQYTWSHQDPPMLVNEVLDNTDPRNESSDFANAEEKEEQRLENRNTWKVVKKTSIQANVIYQAQHSFFQPRIKLQEMKYSGQDL